MFVMNAADNLDFCLEFSFPLSASGLKLLDCNFRSVWKNSSVHVPETALPKKVCIGEAICCSC